MAQSEPTTAPLHNADTKAKDNPETPPPVLPMESNGKPEDTKRQAVRAMLDRAVSDLRVESELDKLRRESRETVQYCLTRRLFRKDARPPLDIRFHKNATEFVFRDIKSDVTLSSMKLAFLMIKDKVPDFRVRSVTMVFGPNALLSFVCHHIKQAHDLSVDIFESHRYKKLPRTSKQKTTLDGKADPSLKLKRAPSNVANGIHSGEASAAKRMKLGNGAGVSTVSAVSVTTASRIPDVLETIRLHTETLLGPRTPLETSAAVSKLGAHHEITVSGYNDLSHDYMFSLRDDVEMLLNEEGGDEFRSSKVDIVYKFATKQFTIIIG